MTKIKRSFLERLTGSSKLPEDEENVNVFQERRSPQTSSFFEEETPYNFNSPREREEQSFDETPASTEDNEGQLTIDVYQTDNDIVIKSTIAGVKPEDLDVSINNDMITIRGTRRNEEEVMEENYYYQECYWGTFSRSVILPVDVIPDKSEAAMKNGILTIRIPKADSNKAKKIQVRGF